MKVKSHTILFTEACPLNCRYCYLKDHEDYGKNPPLKEEEILNEIARIDKEDDKTQYLTQLLLTGGEPFLYPDLIKKIISTYGNRFWYTFNTSGYLFTEEMLKFLSKYRVSFVLSVDGDDRLTNYLRPVRDNKYHVGYMKKLKEILPTLLFYFPSTPFRIIVNPRYVDTLYQQYLFAEQLGFRYFTFILDFESRPSNPKNGSLVWSRKYTDILEQEIGKIVEEIILGWENDIQKPQVVDLNNVVKFLLNGSHFDSKNLPCQVFNGRSMMSLSDHRPKYCMASNFPNIEDCENEMNRQFKEQNGKCKINPECPAFEYCAYRCCPKNSLDAYGEFFHFEDLECALNEVTFKGAVIMLDKANKRCPESKYYLRYIRGFLRGC